MSNNINQNDSCSKRRDKKDSPAVDQDISSTDINSTGIEIVNQSKFDIKQLDDKEQELSLCQRLKKNYAPSVLFFFFFCHFAGAFQSSKNLCQMYIFKEVFKLQPEQAQMFDTVFLFSSLFRIPISLAIDLRILRYRKYILFVSGCISTSCFLAIASGLAMTPKAFLYTLLIECLFGNLVICTIKETLWVEQARNDIAHGQGDLNTIFSVAGTTGSAIGCLIGTYLVDIKQPLISFWICSMASLISAINSFILSDEIDNNPLVTGKDSELLKYENKQRKLYPEKYADGNSQVEPPCLSMQFKFKLKSIWKGLQIPSIKKFILFQLLQGLCMPTFPVFDYYYAIDVLKISLDMINLQCLWLGWVGFLIPFIYQKYFVKRNFIYMIILSHFIYIMGDSIGVSLALGLNNYYGIPAKFGYVAQQMSNMINSGFNQFPAFLFFGKVVPQGIESTTVSILFYFIILNNYIFRQSLGLYINDKFMNVTRENMDNYVYLKMISVVCDFIPFLFMFYLTPTLQEADDLQRAIAYNSELPESEREIQEQEDEDQEEREGLLQN